MKDDDYDYFGKGFEGYSHYMQTFENTKKSSGNSQNKKDLNFTDNNKTNSNNYLSFGELALLWGSLIFVIFACIFGGVCMNKSTTDDDGVIFVVTLLVCAVAIAVPIIVLKINHNKK